MRPSSPTFHAETMWRRESGSRRMFSTTRAIWSTDSPPAVGQRLLRSTLPLRADLGWALRAHGELGSTPRPLVQRNALPHSLFVALLNVGSWRCATFSLHFVAIAPLRFWFALVLLPSFMLGSWRNLPASREESVRGPASCTGPAGPAPVTRLPACAYWSVALVVDVAFIVGHRPRGSSPCSRALPLRPGAVPVGVRHQCAREPLCPPPYASPVSLPAHGCLELHAVLRGLVAGGLGAGAFHPQRHCGPDLPLNAGALRALSALGECKSGVGRHHALASEGLESVARSPTNPQFRFRMALISPYPTQSCNRYSGKAREADRLNLGDTLR